MGKGNEQTVDSRGNTTYKQLSEGQIFSVIKEMLIKAFIKAKWYTILYLFQIF